MCRSAVGKDITQRVLSVHGLTLQHAHMTSPSKNFNLLNFFPYFVSQKKLFRVPNPSILIAAKLYQREVLFCLLCFHPPSWYSSHEHFGSSSWSLACVHVSVTQPMYKRHHKMWDAHAQDLHSGSWGWVEYHKWLMFMSCLNVRSYMVGSLYQKSASPGSLPIVKCFILNEEFDDELEAGDHMAHAIYLWSSVRRLNNFSRLSQSFPAILPGYENQVTSLYSYITPISVFSLSVSEGKQWIKPSIIIHFAFVR